MTFRSITKSWIGKALTILTLSVVGSMASGCAIHSQSPIKEVAYDFSDADFYDKDYAPSPNYEGEYQEFEVALPAPDAAATTSLSIRQPAE
jgi:hypothetical protein